MAMELLSAEYNYLRPYSKQTFTDPLKAVMELLKGAMTEDGFALNAGPRLWVLRGILLLHEDEHILNAAGINPGSNASPDSVKLMKAAAIKFLRHVYCVYERGSQKVWVVSLPKKYNRYPSDELFGARASMPLIRSKLRDKDEQFSWEQKMNLGAATNLGLTWCMKVLKEVGLAEKPQNTAERDKIKRWFSDGSIDEDGVTRLAQKLKAGIRKVIAVINSNQIIYTDMPSIRSATGGDDLGFLNAFAFVYSGRYEKIPIVYIERAFFGKNNTPLGPKELWALTIVHELTHLEFSTKDHKYDFDGLKVRPGFSAAQAIDNADSWAYYIADAAGALTENQVKKVMKGW